MALGAALVDRARPIRKRKSAERVEGMTMVRPVSGEWFKARLFPVASPAEEDEQRGRRRALKRPQLMYGVKDAVGDPIVLSFDARVEVDSPQLGRSIWRVTGVPQPMRKKRSVIGFLADVEQVDEAESREIGPPSVGEFA